MHIYESIPFPRVGLPNSESLLTWFRIIWENLLCTKPRAVVPWTPSLYSPIQGHDVERGITKVTVQIATYLKMVWRFNNPPPPTAPTGQASDLKFDMQGPQVIRFWATEAIFDMLPQAWDWGWADMKGRVTLAPPWISGFGATYQKSPRWPKIYSLSGPTHQISKIYHDPFELWVGVGIKASHHFQICRDLYSILYSRPNQL